MVHNVGTSAFPSARTTDSIARCLGKAQRPCIAAKAGQIECLRRLGSYRNRRNLVHSMQTCPKTRQTGRLEFLVAVDLLSTPSHNTAIRIFQPASAFMLSWQMTCFMRPRGCTRSLLSFHQLIMSRLPCWHSNCMLSLRSEFGNVPKLRRVLGKDAVSG